VYVTERPLGNDSFYRNRDANKNVETGMLILNYCYGSYQSERSVLMTELDTSRISWPHW
jgi:hypothetical protein